MVHPREFLTEYVDPATLFWRKNQYVKHLAIHAITQMDVLAEVVALWTSHPKVQDFRDVLGAREKALGIIREAHNSHKHGALTSKRFKQVSQGQRPTVVTKSGYFLNHSFIGGPPTPYDALVYILDDGTEKEISVLLAEARTAWDRELARLQL